MLPLALAPRIQGSEAGGPWPWTRPTRKRTRRWPLLHSAQRDLARAVEVRTNELSEANSCRCAKRNCSTPPITTR